MRDGWTANLLLTADQSDAESGQVLLGLWLVPFLASTALVGLLIYRRRLAFLARRRAAADFGKRLDALLDGRPRVVVPTQDFRQQSQELIAGAGERGYVLDAVVYSRDGGGTDLVFIRPGRTPRQSEHTRNR